MNFLSLVPIYFGPRQDLLDELIRRLAESFRIPVRVRPPWFDPEKAFEPSRGQYHSSEFLAALIDEPPERGSRILGVTSVDLFIPVFTFVFGEAQLNDRAAVVSTYRLKNELYGLPVDDAVLIDRLHKESVHELGHTFGLIHCDDDSCVMRASSYVEEIELKTNDFCAECRKEIGRL